MKPMIDDSFYVNTRERGQTNTPNHATILGLLWSSISVVPHLSQHPGWLVQGQEDRSCRRSFPAATASRCVSSASRVRWRRWPRWTRPRRRVHLPPERKGSRRYSQSIKHSCGRRGEAALTLMCFPLLPITNASSTSQSTSFSQTREKLELLHRCECGKIARLWILIRAVQNSEFNFRIQELKFELN